MNIQRLKYFHIIAISVILLSLLACAGPKPTPSPTQSTPSTATVQPASPAATPGIAPTPTRTPAIIATPTVAQLTPVPAIPAPTPAPTATPTTLRPTPDPTPTTAPVPITTPVPTTPRPTPAPTTPAPTTPATAPAPQPTPSTPSAREISLQWLGQSTFILTSSQGTRVLIDPTSPGTGYTISPISGVDVVTVGHEHSDHNNVSLATGTPIIIRGLSASGWNDISQTVKDVAIRSVATYHDSEQGARRGRNTVFIFQVDSLRVVYLSDLGHLLTPEQVQSIGAVDVLMIPVGGNFTIDAAQATQVMQQLSPKIVIPMHYKTAATSASLPIVGVDDFLVGKKVARNLNIVRVSKADLPAETTVVVMNYQ